MLALSREYERYLFVLAEFAEAQRKSRKQRETLEAYVARKHVEDKAVSREWERENRIKLQLSMGSSSPVFETRVLSEKNAKNREYERKNWIKLRLSMGLAP